MDFLMPRNEYEMCDLFEKLLLMKTDQFLNFDGGNFTREDKVATDSIKLSKTGMGQLVERGIVNRIFRRWFQTTWGDFDWCRDFKGETPRQELGRMYPELIQGETFISVQLVSRGGEWKVEPILFNKKELADEGGAMTLGLKNFNEKGCVLSPPNFDPLFKSFADELTRLGKLFKFKITKISQGFNAEQYFHTFWFTRGMELALSCHLDVDETDIVNISKAFQECIDFFTANQGSDASSFIGIDDLMYSMWGVLMEFDERLLSHDEIIKSGTAHLRKRRDQNSIYSTVVFHNLGATLDEKFLFPLDRYFGGAEIVWTDQKNFIHDLSETYFILNNADFKKPPFKQQFEEFRHKEMLKGMFSDFEEYSFDPAKLWLAPPTVFRVLDSVRKYL